MNAYSKNDIFDDVIITMTSFDSGGFAQSFFVIPNKTRKCVGPMSTYCCAAVHLLWFVVQRHRQQSPTKTAKNFRTCSYLIVHRVRRKWV